jgi:deoxyribodipyrimidine photo-lyase
MKWTMHLLAIATLFMISTTVRSMAANQIKSANTQLQRRSVVLHWFRHGDLRLHDNPALAHSAKLIASNNQQHPNGCVLPIFVFDANIFGANRFTPSGGLKCGPRRARFILESVADLRQHLETRLGSKLLVAHGEPCEIFDQVLSQLKGCDVNIVCQEEVVKEEKDSAKKVRSVLRKHFPKGKLLEIWGSTMYDLQGMPYDEGLGDMPDGFTPFRNKVEKKHAIAKPLPIPAKLPFSSDLPIDGLMTEFPRLQDLQYTDEQAQQAYIVDPNSVLDFRGGETAALARVKEYIWDKDLLKDYFDTRNGMIGGDYSTKFSPWLAHGCLSPRQVVLECQRYEQQRVANKSTYWVVFELLWRDFCKFLAVKHGNAIFFPNGITSGNKQWKRYEANYEAWKEGRTGYPLVDASMREMKATGFMSNRSRQNVASFLAIDLAYDWRCGGDWFESQLIDYDVYSNWVVSTTCLRRAGSTSWYEASERNC